jgi:hypothetical protein
MLAPAEGLGKSEVTEDFSHARRAARPAAHPSLFGRGRLTS